MRWGAMPIQVERLPLVLTEFSNKEEQALFDAVERGEFRSLGDPEARRAHWKRVAKNTINGRRMHRSATAGRKLEER